MLEIGRSLDQLLASGVMEYDMGPDVNMRVEIRCMEREADRKCLNVLRVVEVSSPCPSGAMA